MKGWGPRRAGIGAHRKQADQGITKGGDGELRGIQDVLVVRLMSGGAACVAHDLTR